MSNPARLSLAADALVPARLAARRPSAPLEPSTDPAFDRLASLAATMLQVPRAFVTLVDDPRDLAKVCRSSTSVRRAGDDDTFERQVYLEALTTERPLIVEDIAWRGRPEQSPTPDSDGATAWASFPFFDAEGQLLGALSVVDTEPRRWSTRDIEILASLAHAAAAEYASHAAIAALQASEGIASELARTLQQSLLPAAPPSVPGLEIAARYLPAGIGVRVGGDFYDVFRLPGRAHCALTIGDVSGHGVEAAKVASLARHTIRATAMTGARPAKVLEALNQALLAQEAPDGSEPLFLTATYAHLRLEGGGAVARVANGGHCPTLVRRAEGTVEVVTTSGLPLGWFADPQLRIGRAVLRPGDAVVLYTDGVSEARRDGVMLGDDALQAVLENAPEGADADHLAQLLEQTAVDFGGAQPRDDTAVLVVRLCSGTG